MHIDAGLNNHNQLLRHRLENLVDPRQLLDLATWNTVGPWSQVPVKINGHQNIKIQ